MWEIRLQRSWPLGLPVSAAFNCLSGNGRNRDRGGGGRGHVFQSLVAAELSAQQSKQGWSCGASGCGQRKLCSVLRDVRPDRGCARPGRKSAQAVGRQRPHYPSPPPPAPSTRPEGSSTSQPAATPGDGQAASWPHPQHPCLSSNGLPDARDHHIPGAPLCPLLPGLAPRTSPKRWREPHKVPSGPGRASRAEK